MIPGYIGNTLIYMAITAARISARVGRHPNGGETF